MKREPSKVLLASLLTVVATLLVCLGLEIGLRVSARVEGRYCITPEQLAARNQGIMQSSPDPELIYSLRPNYVKNGVRYTESHGILHTTEVSLVNHEQAFRIAVIGDSISAGLGQRERYGSQPFPDRLEKILRSSPEATGVSVEVLNFGTDGYGTLQEARLLETLVKSFSPDLIIVQFCFNDIGNSYTPTIWFMDPKPPPLYLYDFVAKRLGLSRPTGLLDPSSDQYVPDCGPMASSPEAVAYWRNMYAPDGPGRRRLSDGFRRIATVADRLDAPVVAVVFPLLTGDEGDTELLGSMHAAVLTEIRKNGFSLVDLAMPFSRLPPKEIRENHPGDHYHPSPLGHAIAAQYLSTFILKNFAIKGR